jgi:hypothetical protein
MEARVQLETSKCLVADALVMKKSMELKTGPMRARRRAAHEAAEGI